jgi:dihydrodipicolinate synthase/N-acetylneuraminate lyase
MLCYARLPNLNPVDSCGDVGKLTRIAATVSEPSFASVHPRKNKDAPFLVLGGFTDFILPGAYANGHGAITGLANVAPVSKRITFLFYPSDIVTVTACDRETVSTV